MRMEAAIAAAVAAVCFATPALAGSPAPTSQVESLFPRGLPYAQHEDACAGVHRCVWDGRHQGNGRGQSLILTRYRGGYLMTPVSHREAHRLQAKWCKRPGVGCGYGD